MGVLVYLALIDQTLPVSVNELDRIFDRDDVILAVVVDMVDHRGKSGALARSGWPGHQDQPLG